MRIVITLSPARLWCSLFGHAWDRPIQGAEFLEVRFCNRCLRWQLWSRGKPL